MVVYAAPRNAGCEFVGRATRKWRPGFVVIHGGQFGSVIPQGHVVVASSVLVRS